MRRTSPEVRPAVSGRNTPLPIGQGPAKPSPVTASAGRANRSGEAVGSLSRTVSSSGPTTLAETIRGMPERAVVDRPAESQLRATACAVTSEPSQKRASGRSVKLQRRPPSPCDQALASPGRTRPSQSTSTSVS